MLMGLVLHACSATNKLSPPSDDDSSSGPSGGGGAVPSGGSGGTGLVGGTGGAGGGDGGTGGAAALGGSGGEGGTLNCSPPASASAPHYVNPLGSDNIATHGGGSGKCALATIAYALSQATDEIHVSAGIYNVTGSPITLSGTQHLVCDISGGTTLAGQAVFGSSSFSMRLTGNGSAASHCKIAAGGTSPGYCIQITGDDVTLDKLTIANCGGAAIKVDGDAVSITNCTINHTAPNVFFMQPRSANISNNTFHASSTDVKCNKLHNYPLGTNTIIGTGNTHPGGSVTCSGGIPSGMGGAGGAGGEGGAGGVSLDTPDCNCPAGFE